VVDGESAADESLLTGESRPVAKLMGDDALIGGSVNTASPLVMRVERVGENTRLAAIQRLMERAATEKPRLVEVADRVAGRFIVALLVLAVATAMAWWWIDASRALWVFVAVLVVSCPCALSLATPAALTVATGALAAEGVLVTRGHAIEALARADRFVFDKTGTLDAREDDPGFGPTRAGRKRRGAQDCRYARTRIGASDRARADDGTSTGRCPRRSGFAALPAPGSKALSTAGWFGSVARSSYRRPMAMRFRMFWEMFGDGDTVIALGDATGWLAFFRLSDGLRPEAVAMTSQLGAMGVKLSMFSGDSLAAARSVGAALGFGYPRRTWAGGQACRDGRAAGRRRNGGDGRRRRQ
jgi:Cu2+-exporting ATPase